MKKITWAEMEHNMYMFNKVNGYKTKGNKKAIYAVVVFKEDSFTKPYTETERSYRFSSDNKAFFPDAISNSIFADCLDGTDNGVRIDWYMHDPENRWEVDYCYMEDSVVE